MLKVLFATCTRPGATTGRISRQLPTAAELRNAWRLLWRTPGSGTERPGELRRRPTRSLGGNGFRPSSTRERGTLICFHACLHNGGRSRPRRRAASGKRILLPYLTRSGPVTGTCGTPWKAQVNTGGTHETRCLGCRLQNFVRRRRVSGRGQPPPSTASIADIMPS